MKRVLKTMPIALLTVLFVLTLAFAVLTGTTVFSTTTDGVAEAAFQPLAGITFSDFLNAQYGSGGNSGNANITKGGITFKVGEIKDKGTDYLLIEDQKSFIISFSLPQDITNVAITIYAKLEMPAGGEIGNGNIRVNNNLSNDLANPTDNNWEIAGTYRLNPAWFNSDSNNTIRIWFNVPTADYKIIDLQFSAKNTTNPDDPTTHTVLLDKNGGSGGADSVEVTNGSAMPTITSLPTRSGYSFKGYYSATSGGTQYYKADGTSAKNWDKNYGSTLYAQWIQSSTVTLNKNNGTGGTNSVVAEPGKAMPTATMPSRTGYTFQGYYDTSATTGGTQYYKADGSSARNWDKTGNQTLWARWTPINYSIGYTLNGGTATNTTSYNIETATFTLNNPTRTGYTFAGWTGSNGSTPQTSVSVAKGSTGNKTYTANWTANQYTVTLDDNGGSGGPGAVEVYFDSNFAPIEAAQIPTKAGYVFAGYYDEQNVGDVVASPSGTLYITENGGSAKAWDKPNNATLYAYYKKVMTVSSAGYEADYDGDPHTITVTVTDPASGYFILYHDPETSLNTDVNPAKTNVCNYTIDFYVSKAGYTQYHGSATIVIKEVDKTALSALIDEVSDYYDGIKDDYPTIASTLEGHKQQIINDYITNKNVTAEQVAAAIDELAGYLSTAKVDVTKAKIDAIGSGEYTVEAPKIQDARDYYDDMLSAEEKAQVGNYADLQAAETFYGPVGDVVDEISALGAITDPQEFKSAVETARAHYDALSDDQKDVFPADTLKILTDSEAVIAVMDKVNAIGASEDTQSFRDKVSSARADYTALSDDQKGIFLGSVLKVLTDDEAAIDAMDKINAIGTVAYTAESKGKIDTANTAYEALDATQKALVANYDTLEQANDDYDSVHDAVLAINSIGTVYYVDEIKNLIEDARELVDGLSDYQASILPEESLKTLVDDEAAYEAMGKINAIPDVIENTAANLALVDVAKDFFDGLTEDQQDKVRPNFVSKLEDAVAAANAIKAVNAIGDVEYTQEDKDAIDAAKDLLEALTDKQDDFIPDGFADHLADIEAVYDALASIATIGTPENTEDFRDKVEGAREAYDDLTDEQKDLVLPAYVKGIEDAEAVVAAMDEVDAIGAVEYTADTKDRIDAARAEYDGLTADQKGIFPADTLKTLVDAEKAYEAMDKISAIGDVELTDASKELIDEARETYDALTADQKALVDPDKLQTLIDAEKAYEAMDKISAIGELEYTEACKELIDQARAYYDALTDAQKAAVDNHDDLTKAERDYAAVDSSVNSVTDIEGIRYDQTNQELILGAREEYEALTVEQKAFFPEDVYQALIDKERAIAALEKIAAIGDVAYNEDSEALIQEAREAYDGLTDEQKALIHADDVSTLTVAEQNYGKLDTDARTTYTVLLVFVCILLAAGLALLVFLVYRIMKGKKKNASSMMSVAFFPALLGASHYVDSPFLALYILAALTVLVFVADIILAIKYPKIFKSLKNIFKKGEEQEEEEPVPAPKKEKPAREPMVSIVKETPVAKVEQKPVAVEPKPTEQEDREDGEEEETIVVTENGTTFRIQFIKSFTAKLIQSGDETKEYYKVLKNEILSYKGIKSRTSWHYDSFNAGRNQLIKISVRGKTLCLYFALAIKDLQGSKYKVEYCESAKYAAVPCMYRIRNDRRCEYAKDLIAMVAEKFGLVKGENPNEQYSFPYESTAALLEKGLIKEVKTKIAQPVADGRTVLHSVDVAEADRDMTDEVAATYIVDDVDGKVHSGKKGIVNIDVLSANFNDGDTVDIEALWAKKLVPASVGRVKLLAKGTLDKSLNVDLQDYSLQAVKMIVLVGGTVHRAK